MNDERLRAAWARVLEARERTDDCASLEALLAVVDGSATEPERLRTLAHVGACPHCRADLDLLRTAVDAAVHVARPVWRGRSPLVAAASVVVLLGAASIWRMTHRPPGPEPERSGAAAEVRLIAPPEDAPAARPVTLLWASVEAARRYRVEILDASNAVVFATATTDTILRVPAGTLAPDAAYRWWVRAEVVGGTRASAMRRLRTTTR